MSSKPKNNISKTLSVMTLAIMNIAAVVSLRGLPSEATYGLSSAFYYLFAAFVFLIPTALVAAELASMFSNKDGGMFRWVGEAYGKRTGFLAIFLQWVESTIWYPTALTFGAVTIAYIGLDTSRDAVLASNKIFTLLTVLILYWIATFISLKGLGWVSKISKLGTIIGTLIPALLLVIFAIVYLTQGGTNHIDLTQSFFPDLSRLDNLVLASGIFLSYSGMEMMGVHITEVKEPAGKNYTKALFIGAITVVIIYILGTYSLGVIIPVNEINLTQSLLIGFDNFLAFFRLSWVAPFIAIALMFGVLSSVLTWVSGPSKGIFTVGKAGYLPPFFQKTNKGGVQKNILYVQGIVVSLLSLLFVVMPSVQSFYQILTQLTVLLYLIIYLLMFTSALILRYKLPHAKRPFAIGKTNNILIWLVAGLGLCSATFALILSFIPPSQIETGNKTVWFTVLIGGVILFVSIPFIIYALRKPSWKAEGSEIAPFHWEENPTENNPIQ